MSHLKLYSENKKKEIPVHLWDFRVNENGRPIGMICRSDFPLADTEHGFIYFVVYESGRVEGEFLIYEQAKEILQKLRY